MQDTHPPPLADDTGSVRSVGDTNKERMQTIVAEWARSQDMLSYGKKRWMTRVQKRERRQEAPRTNGRAHGFAVGEYVFVAGPKAEENV